MLIKIKIILRIFLLACFSRSYSYKKILTVHKDWQLKFYITKLESSKKNLKNYSNFCMISIY